MRVSAVKARIVEFLIALYQHHSRQGPWQGNVAKGKLKKQGIEFYLSHKVTGASAKDNKAVVTATDPDGKEVSFSGDYCLVCVGRKAYTEGLGLDKIGITVDKRGKIPVNDHLETGVKSVCTPLVM